MIFLLLSLYLFHTCTAFDKRTSSAREIWRQMQATRYHRANPKLKINTDVSGTAAAPEVVFKLIDDTEVSVLIVSKCARCIVLARERKSGCMRCPLEVEFLFPSSLVSDTTQSH